MLKRVNANRAIPQFALYGEQTLKQDPEFVHIEDISDRSSKNGWLIKPHRHTHLFQILYMFDGELDLQLDETNSTHKGSWVISIPAGVVHGFKFRPDTKGIVLSISTNLFGLNTEDFNSNLPVKVMSQNIRVNCHKAPWFHQQMLKYLDLIKRELSHSDKGQQIILYSLSKIVLTTLRRQYDHDRLTDGVHHAEFQFTGKFKKLLEEHYKEHWKISDYAKALHISVSTLNRLCNIALGTSAKSLIQERILIEAKRRLIYTRQPLAEIAYTLGYKDPAYFSRAFKQLEGLSPKSFRQLQQ